MIRTFMTVLAFFFISLPADAKPELYVSKGLAVKGYDVVSYHSKAADENPDQGSEAFETVWKGAKWRFASQANLDAFTADPERYAPEYGGYCAYAISAQNKLVKTDPRDWKLHNGKLYLNYSASLRRKWEADPDMFITTGDANWATHLPSLDKL